MTMPWNDRSGRFSPLKAVTLTGLLVPALLLAYRFVTGSLGPRPFDEAIHEAGDWAIRFLVLSLAVTPLRRILDWPKLILVRRMIGLSALFYALGHFALYILDLDGNLTRVAVEIVSRIYLTIGFAALLGLTILGVTSTDAAIRRLGGNWARLHRIVYGIGILAALHFFMQTKADVYEATLVSGLFILLMTYRVLHARGLAIATAPVQAGAALVAAFLTAAVEFAWYALATGVPPLRVLEANLHFSYMIRPAWWVLACGLAVIVFSVVTPLLRRGDPTPRRGRPKPSAA